MAETTEFENILNECLDRLIKGETIESCLAQYPQYAAELEPLLKTAQDAHQAAALKPTTEFRQQAASEFQEAIRNLPVKKAPVGFKWQVQWVAPVVIVIALLAGGSGTAVAATNALPDSPLYSLKMAIESIQMTFTLSDEGKAELYARFIDYRVEEIVKMAENGNLTELALATENLNKQFVTMANFNLNNINQGDKAATFGVMTGNEGTQTPTQTIPPQTDVTEGFDGTKVAQPTDTADNVTTQEPSPTRATDTGGLSDVEKLKIILTEKFEQNLQILYDLLEQAPDSLKPAIENAISIIIQGYQQAIANLG